MSSPTINWDLAVPGDSTSGSAPGITEAGEIKAKPGKLWDLICIAPGAITLLDGTGGSGSTLLPSVQMAAGEVLSLHGFPFFDGLYASAVSGEFNLSFT